MTEDVASGSAAVHVRFNGRSGRPLTVDLVTAGDVLPPEAVEATDAAGAAVIDAFVARRRAELARLSLAARTARQRCERAETELAALAEADADGVPADLLAVVDAMLEKATAASALALAAAEREAAFLIDRAMADGAEVVRRAGLDPTVVMTGRPSGSAPRSVVAAPTAAELWRATRRTSAPSPSVPSSPPVPPRPMQVAPRVGDGPVATLVRDDAVAPSRTEPGEAFDTFWQEVPGERRVRDRLLRRSPKESA
jgi:hypothetical protein